MAHQQDPFITQATPDHIPELVDFLQAAYADTYPNDRGITRDMFTGDAFRDHLHTYLGERLVDADSTLLFAQIGANILGTIGVNTSNYSDAAEVWGFYVASEAQGQGNGERLWNAMLGQPAVKSVRTLYLSVAKDSETAIDFYTRKGFNTAWDEEWQWPTWVEQNVHNQYWKMYRKIR